MDDDDGDVFKRTVDWAVDNVLTTATFHIMTPYPGTRLYRQMQRAGRLTTTNWDLYDTRHVVYRPARLSPAALKAGYEWAYREFYRWPRLLDGALTHSDTKHRLKHFFYAAGWKKFEPFWDVVIKAQRLPAMTPLLEAVLSKVSRQEASIADRTPATSPEDLSATSSRSVPP